jgi:hypothetical protein
MKLLPYLLIAASFIAFSAATFAQDSLKNDEKIAFIPRKNVIRYNPTPNALGFKSIIFGYERVVGKHQSFSLNAGFLAFNPSEKKLARSDSLNTNYGLEQTRDNKGFSIAADYRFYLKKENKYPAQRGIYVGPYVAFYNLESTNTIRKTDDFGADSEAGIQTNILILNFGAELGYQFVIKNRVTIDLILAGPSVSRYRLRMKGKGSLTIDDPELDESLKALRDILVDQYNWLAPLFDGEAVEVTGTTSTWGVGLRYVLQVGFRF